MESLRMPMSRRTFLKTAVASLVGTAFSGVGGLTYATRIEPEWIEVTHISLTLPRLDRAFHGYRMVQISDLHVDSWLGKERLDNVIRSVNEQQPDMVAITGDFVSYDLEPFNSYLIDALRQLTPRDGSLAVLGNHDHWANSRGVREIIARSGLVDVNNQFITLQRGGAELHFCGVDDVYEAQDRLDLVLDKLPRSGAAILLAHEPDFADRSAETERFDLQISGHTHGGQVYLPFIGAPILPRLGRKYPSGLYQVGEMLQYTNRGVGMVRPAVRFNCRPEITVFTLQSPDV